MNSRLSTFLAFIVTLLTPIALLGLGLRLLLSPLFLQIEYNMPYFPADEYGFTKQDRLHWAPYAVEYLVNSADISYLGDLKFEDGSPLYNERELSHMQDVKRVTQGALQTLGYCSRYASSSRIMGLARELDACLHPRLLARRLAHGGTCRQHWGDRCGRHCHQS